MCGKETTTTEELVRPAGGGSCRKSARNQRSAIVPAEERYRNSLRFPIPAGERRWRRRERSYTVDGDEAGVDGSPESRAREATRFFDHQLASLLRLLCMPETKGERGRKAGATAVRRRRDKEARRGGAGSGGRKNERKRGRERGRR
ncbi:hypothetical protein JCGZ_25240 [Jatropha curcas]|uniref:Uncharacterized protein n=1 Tax=Jatropha curcas TaxID=180498 RepID=A0A067LFZ0_JATCU|nr:hypothetical protein JCGZ_25240 [Jatropha curcas]